MAYEYTYTKSVNLDRLTLEIAQDALITKALDHIDSVGTALSIWFKAELATGEKTELDTVVSNHINVAVEPDASPVKPISDLVTTWSVLKEFHMMNLGCHMNFIDLGTYYYVWLCFRNQKFYLPRLDKNTTDATDFETNFKPLCNVPEAPEMRLSTCRFGRKLHSRFISFHTATANGYNNDNYLDQDHGDATYTMVDADRNVTTNPSLCKETWIDWEPLYSYEVAGGAIYIPSSLPGDQDLWAMHVIGAPDYPAQYGGSVEFISNPRLKWRIGGWLEEDESLNPANTNYVPGYHFTKVRWILKHPVGAQAEFQIHMRIFK